ncbi:HIT family protein [uncultured Rikenella sp.]|uniref:HIT family protein n=1 Tax=uncultured Rikenella sp. TaxID=368003 RepID=UPI002605CDA5|nr:HIT family protein [uncultured Rikenella sp.]
MSTIFSKIIRGEIPGYKVAEDERHFAFLDIHPLAEGHTLVVPKREVDYIFDLAPEELAELMTFAQKVAEHIRAAVPCQRIGVAVIGLDVPHAHIHLVPISEGGDLDFSRPKLNLTPEEFQAIQAKIRF